MLPQLVSLVWCWVDIQMAVCGLHSLNILPSCTEVAASTGNLCQNSVINKVFAHLLFSQVSEGFAINSEIKCLKSYMRARSILLMAERVLPLYILFEALSSTKLWWIIHSQLVDQLRNIYFTTGNGETEYIQNKSVLFIKELG